jgi:putative glutamine amidotransferase
MRPLILVTPSTQVTGAELLDHSISVGSRYLQAVLAAGGLPVALPLVTDRAELRAYLERADGVLLTGGDDIAPAIHRPGVTSELLAKCECAEPARDVMELSLLDELFKRPRPLLAICRGHQVVNIALGGTLYVDLPTERPGRVNHAQVARKYEVVHEVEVTPGSAMHAIYQRSSLGVNTTHHQAIHRLAEPLAATILAPDGVIEGTEFRADAPPLLPWFRSVQFHPERLFDRHPEHGLLFQAFIAAARQFRQAARP